MQCKRIGIFAGLLTSLLVYVLLFNKSVPYVVSQYETYETVREDLLSEEEALHDDPITDILEAVSIKESSIRLIGKKNKYRIGDSIELAITLKTGYGERKKRGGDKLHVRHFNSDLQAFAPGYVTDHNNGSYTAFVHAVWPGKQIISISLAYRREIIRSLYAVRNKHVGTRTISGLFDKGTIQEEHVCQPRREWLPQYREVCNLTADNGGMSWYCGKPLNTTLLCEDWTSTKAYPQTEKGLVGDIELKLKNRKPWFPNITVTVKGQMQERQNLPLCSTLPKSLSWKLTKPTGFFYKEQWYLHHCKFPKETNYKNCFQNKRLLLFGDSTLRQWYVNLSRQLPCVQITEAWTKKAWHKRSVCVVDALNFTMEWTSHAQPFFVGKEWFPNRYSTHSIASSIDALSGDIPAIIVVHMYSHVIYWHPSVFQDRMRAVSRSIKHFLNRNKDAKVLVKGPHTFTNTSMSYFSYVYSDILKEEFNGLYDKVVFMDQADMTVAKENRELHPPRDISEEAVRQFLAYVCM